MTDRPVPSGPAGPDLRIVQTRVYRGPNVWSYGPAVHLVVHLGSLEEYPTDLLPGFAGRLLNWLPGVGEHSCSRGRQGGFAERLNAGTWLGHVVEHVAIQLQNEAGHPTTRGRTRSTGAPGQYHVVYGYQDESVAVAAGRLAVRIVNDLVAHDPAFDFAAELEAFLMDAEATAFGPSTRALVDEAAARDIPWMRLDEGSLVLLGHGCHARRIRATMTSGTSALGVEISTDRDLTYRLLAAAGVPVPDSEVVRTLRGAVDAAGRIGYPVVVKPFDPSHGRGVVLDLADEAGLEAAYDVAGSQSPGRPLRVEGFIAGRDYRFLVVGGRMVAVAERVPAHVLGDGQHTVTQLVEATNEDPRRGVGHEKALTRIKVDDAARALVAAQGLAMESIPDAGAVVRLSLSASMSTGGTCVDRTADAHPDNVECAEEAARVIGLDVAGVDFIAPDIAESVRDTGGAICGVSASPGLRMHTDPTIGEPRHVAAPVLDLLFPPGAASRVPIVAVTGTSGKTTVARMISHILKGTGRKVGMASTDGVLVDERLVIRVDASGPSGARMVLQNPGVDLAVLEVAREGILREGLGYDRNDVAVVLNVDPDDLGVHGGNTIEDLADVKSVVVEAVPRGGCAVLNADDPNVAAMARRCHGELVWFSMADEGAPARAMIDRHCREHGIGVVLERGELGESIVLRHGRRSMQVAFTHTLPASLGGTARFNVANALAAAGACFAAGVHLHDIGIGLGTFCGEWPDAVDAGLGPAVGND
ncbi:MAG: cyanophycin synthetase [Candidatus Nanopelagicales bacterium]